MTENHPAAPVRLIVGLGNPGPAYRANRHNLGFRVVDELARRRGLSFRTQPAGCDLARAPEGRGILFLLKPLTYMNRSGDALLNWSAASGVPLAGEGAADLLVVCDDLALPLGSLRLRAGGQDGGQKGLASILAAVGTPEFPRLRLGIAGGEGQVPPENWADYVLEDFPPDEAAIAENLVSYACDALEYWLRHGSAATAARFNRRIDPPAPEGDSGDESAPL